MTSNMNDLAWFLANTLDTLIAQGLEDNLLIYLSAFLSIFFI